MSMWLSTVNTDSCNPSVCLSRWPGDRSGVCHSYLSRLLYWPASEYARFSLEPCSNRTASSRYNGYRGLPLATIVQGIRIQEVGGQRSEVGGWWRWERQISGGRKAKAVEVRGQRVKVKMVEGRRSEGKGGRKWQWMSDMAQSLVSWYTLTHTAAHLKGSVWFGERDLILTTSDREMWLDDISCSDTERAESRPFSL